MGLTSFLQNNTDMYTTTLEKYHSVEREDKGFEGCTHRY